jgi:hypothetical protein
MVVPIGSDIAARGPAGGLLTPLEAEPSTHQERADAERARFASTPDRRDMLIGQVPGTDLIVGLSRRPYGACKALATAENALLRAGDQRDLRPSAPTC